VRKRFLIPVVVIAVVGTSVLYATQARSPLGKHRTHAAYTTTEVFEFLLFSTGRVVDDHPGLHQPGTYTTVSNSKLRAAAESLTGCIHRFDAAAAPALTSAFNAADAQRIDGALNRVNAAARQWMATPYKQDDPCPPPPPPPYEGPIQEPDGFWHMTGDIAGNYVLAVDTFYALGVTVGGVVAISGYLLIAYLFAVWVACVLAVEFIWYEFEHPPSDLDRQTGVAKLVKTLRS
jgi:hypothetical protein